MKEFYFTKNDKGEVAIFAISENDCVMKWCYQIGEWVLFIKKSN